MTMNINLTPQLEQLVRSKVTTGLYNSASEVVREALRLMAVSYTHLDVYKRQPPNSAPGKRHDQPGLPA